MRAPELRRLISCLLRQRRSVRAEQGKAHASEDSHFKRCTRLEPDRDLGGAQRRVDRLGRDDHALTCKLVRDSAPLPPLEGRFATSLGRVCSVRRRTEERTERRER